MRKWAILPRRFGGTVPGILPVASEAYAASAMCAEGFVNNSNKRMAKRKEGAPLSTKCLPMRMGGRASFISGGDPTCIENHLNSACDNTNGTAA